MSIPNFAWALDGGNTKPAFSRRVVLLGALHDSGGLGSIGGINIKLICSGRELMKERGVGRC